MINRIIKQSVLLLLLTSLAPMAWAQSAQIVASLHRLKGKVRVVQQEGGATITARDGLLLRNGDTVVTEEAANATIKFRDGSEVRLFQKTRFRIESEEKGKGKNRTFASKLFMKAGSFWGNFVKRRQVARISTPTATIGIKGTTLRVGENNGKARVALTEGLIDVGNEAKTVELRPGKRVKPFSAREDLTTKIEDIPYKLDVTSEKSRLQFIQNQSEEIFLNVQLVEVKSGREVRRAGALYLRSNYDNISYPVEPKLDQRGFARVTLVMTPPKPVDAKLNGNVFVWAVLDEEDADDTGEGRILFTIPVPPSQEKRTVDPRN